MQVIIISSNSKTHKHWHLSRFRLLALTTLLITLIGISTFSFANWMKTTETTSFSPAIPSPLSSTPALTQSKSDLLAQSENDATQGFYARQIGGLQAETVRLKMLSERLAEMVGFDVKEYLLDEQPAQGGIDHEGMSLSADELDNNLQQLTSDLQHQQHALAALEQYLITKDSIASGIPHGKPIKEGWLSSFYGYRIDPFTGKKAFHEGLDFAGKAGSSVVAVADGIVSWVGKRGGYGGLVEVDHGNGYVTRYAHNKTIKVKVGDRISKGQELALMGSTGRSTGPHVHFEVLRDGKHVNPYNFIK